MRESDRLSGFRNPGNFCSWNPDPGIFARGFRNPGNFCLWNPESGKFLLVEFQNLGLWNPEYSTRNLESKFHRQRLEIQNSRLFLDSLKSGSFFYIIQFLFFLYFKFISIHYHTQKQMKNKKINWDKKLTTTYSLSGHAIKPGFFLSFLSFLVYLFIYLLFFPLLLSVIKCSGGSRGGARGAAPPLFLD